MPRKLSRRFLFSYKIPVLKYSAMEITFIGHSCFKIKGKSSTIVIDPYDPSKTGYKLPKLSADLVLISHGHDDHNNSTAVSDTKMVIDAPGEYEVSGVHIVAIPTFHDEKSGSERGRNIMYQISLDGITLLHCGDLGHELSKETLEKMDTIGVLMIPVGGTYTIDAKAAVSVISSVEPGIVIPMHYQTDDLSEIKLDPLKKFLDEMGNGGAKTLDTLKVSSQNDIPEETEIVVLNPAH
jgi:L-ascorbate metabolism protein UlaG (beta-lactamase superfamily)